MASIVVGFDGSEHSKEALRWALEEARLRDASLRVVHAWMLPSTVGYGFAAVPMIEPDVLRDVANDGLDKALDDLADETKGVLVERKIVQGLAAETLVEEAASADLLVVGSRGHGGFAGLLLGSVSQQCAHHAPCPVVIVRVAAARATPETRKEQHHE